MTRLLIASLLCTTAIARGTEKYEGTSNVSTRILRNGVAVRRHVLRGPTGRTLGSFTSATVGDQTFHNEHLWSGTPIAKIVRSRVDATGRGVAQELDTERRHRPPIEYDVTNQLDAGPPRPVGPRLMRSLSAAK